HLTQRRKRALSRSCRAVSTISSVRSNRSAPEKCLAENYSGSCGNRSKEPLDRLGVRMMTARRSVWLVSLALWISTRLIAADPTSIARQAHAWRAAHEKEILQEFCELLAIPDV